MEKEIVIKISEEDYNNIEPFLNGETINGGFNLFKVLEIIKKGTPLPEQHGRLIDVDWVKNTLDIYVINEYNGQFIRRSDIDTIPTIIEADKESESK